MSKQSANEESRSSKRPKTRKSDSPDPVRVIDRAIFHLWETISDLEQIQKARPDHFRVSIFGSSRLRRGDPVYEEVKKLSYELSRLGIDIVTGGGPGLMEAANSGAVEGQVDSGSRSFGLPIHLPSEEAANPFVDKVFRHQTFFSRLHHFVRLSSAFIVMPGGIGTTLETFMVWQLLQVRHIRQVPFILVGTMWPPLIDWIKEEQAARGLVSPSDIEIATLVESADQAMPVVRAVFEKFKQGKV